MPASSRARPRALGARLVRVAVGLSAAVSLTLATATAAAADAVAPAPPPPPGVDTVGLAADLRALVAGDISTAATIEVRRDGNVVWRGSAGVRDRDTKAPVRPDGRFRVGSTTKSPVAAVVLQLVGEGRLRLDDPIDAYLPGLRIPHGPAGEPVRLRHLLNHTSGIPDYADDPALFPDFTNEAAVRTWLRTGRWQTRTARELSIVSLRRPMTTTPGKDDFHYSNTNYLLAGMIIERVTGRTYAEEVERRILRPLGMHDTGFPGDSPELERPYAKAYLRNGGRVFDVTRLNMSGAGASGQMISTTRDLARFDAALLSGKLLRPAELAEMKKTVRGGEDGYGLGLGNWPLTCAPDPWGLGGTAIGTRTGMYASPDGRTTVVVAFNPYGLNVTPAHGRAVDNIMKHTFCGRSG
ncbi:serine hydrolase domain-containing protein [Embleya sp. MST-111070]|uniref:serine hydrolase domain-containing protein n=1 Tax=Embleya sp. MST-111070 TaxID=3398231 RepID=UPI003F73C96F